MPANKGMEPFQFEEYEVRFVGTPDEPEWVAKDVCDVLGIKNPSDTLLEFDEDEKGIAEIDTPGGRQKLLTVTEPGLYKLITRSQKPNAKRFSKWVFKDVLPTIRRTGTYSMNPTANHPQLLPLRVRRERLEIIQIGINILSQIGGIDERTELSLNDLVKNVLLEEQLKKPLLPDGTSGEERYLWPVTDRAPVLGYPKLTPSQRSRIGKVAAGLYRARYGTEPPKREQFVDGATRKVNCYGEEDLEILDSAIHSVMSPPGELTPTDKI